MARYVAKVSDTAPSVRSVAKVFLVVVGLSALIYLVYLSRTTVGLVVISAFLAVALGPPVDYIQRGTRMPRWLAILAVYLLVTMAIVLVGLVVLPPIVEGVSDLARDLPGQIDSLREAQWIQDLNDDYQVIDRLKESVGDIPAGLGAAAGTLQSITFGAFAAVLQLVTVLVMAFLMLLDGPRMVRWVLAQMPDDRRVRLEKVGDDIYRSVSGYVIGNAAISVLAGASTYIVLRLLDIPFAAPLAILMAFLDLIPLVGASLAGIAIFGVSFLGDVPRDPIIWVLFFVGYQQIENNFMQPVVYSHSVKVHPLLVLTSVLVGAGLLGVLGALLAIPVAAVIQVTAVDWWVLRRGPATAEPDPAPA